MDGHDRIFEIANVPPPFQGLRREQAILVPENEKVSQFCLDYLENISRNLATGRGATFRGDPGSGKSYWGCAVLLTLLSRGDVMMRENFSSYRRIDYLELVEEVSRRSFEETPTLLDNLRHGDWIFLDNLFGPPPPTAVLSALLYRRDWQKSTFLAFQSFEVELLPDSFRRLASAFEGRNRALELFRLP